MHHREIISLSQIFSKSSVKLYIDGKYISSENDLVSDGSALASQTIDLGAQYYNGTNQYFHNGYFDEVVFSKTPRSALWIKLCYENQKMDQTLVTVVVDTVRAFVVSEPKNATVPVGTTASFTVAAAGTGTLAYMAAVSVGFGAFAPVSSRGGGGFPAKLYGILL
jgi:hypothetical protein